MNNDQKTIEISKNNILNNFVEELKKIEYNEKGTDITNLDDLFSDDYVKGLINDKVDVEKLNEEGFKSKVLKEFDNDTTKQGLIEINYEVIISKLAEKYTEMPKGPKKEKKEDSEQKILNNFAEELKKVECNEEGADIKNLNDLFSDDYVKGLINDKVDVGKLNEEGFKSKVLKEFDNDETKQELISYNYSSIMNELKGKYDKINKENQPLPGKAGDPILPGQGGSNGTDGNPIQQQEADKAPKAEGSNVGGQPELLAQGKSQQSTKPVVVGEPPRTQIQETRLKSKEPEKKTELANKEDIVNENNTEIARLIMNTRTDNGFNYARMSEARIMNDIIEKQGKEIKILRTDKNNLMNLIKGSTSIMKKNNDLKERQFKQTAKEINSRTNITGLHVEVSEPIIPNKVDFTQLEKLMNEAEAEFNTQYDTFENVLENANSDLDTLNNLYTKNIDILKKFRE